MRKLLLAALAIGLAAAAVIVIRLATESGTGPRPAPPAPVEPAAVPMQFGRDGLAGKITQSVERVTQPGHAQTAVHVRGGGARWVCILTDGTERLYELDAGLRVDDFPALKAGGFQPPPPPVSRTMSIYRSLARTAMGYDGTRGDRIIVLVCPLADWPTLRLQWPPTPR